MKLIGADGESEIHNLTDADKPVFERGAFDMFLLSTPFPIGEVRNVRVQHDNTGGRPSWYDSLGTLRLMQTHKSKHAEYAAIKDL